VIENKPSRTAQGAAMYRAAHQLADRPLVFEDPLALGIVGREAENALRAGQRDYGTPKAAVLRAFVAVRSRFAEDRFAEAFERGLRQYVALGAGLDTFAYRARFDGLRVFEVDHRATQGWKRERLAQAAIAIPNNVVYVPVDFTSERLDEGLRNAGFDFAKPAFFAWLGVTPYLTPEEVMETLGTIAKTMKGGGEIVFDFVAPATQDPQTQGHREAFAARVRSVGEPLKSEFVPGKLADDLGALGFSQVEITDSSTLNARYFSGREDGLMLRGGQLMRTRV